MRSSFRIPVVCVVAFAVVSTAMAAPVQVINETSPAWSGSAPGRSQNEPLDFAVHLSDPNIAGALNNTNSRPFVSASGYVYTGQQGNDPWAFSVASAGGAHFDFTQGTQDLSFDGNNNSGGQFRILLSETSGAGYAVSAETFSTAGWTSYARDLDAMAWNSFNPATMTAGAAATPDFTSIREVGFASLLSNTAAERIDNIVANAEPVAPQLIFERWSNASGSGNIPLDPSVLSDPRGVIALDTTEGGPFVSSNGKYIYTGSPPTSGRRWAFSLATATEGTIDFTQAAEDLTFVEHNSGGQFRVLLSTLPGADYVVSDQTFNSAGWPMQTLDLDSMTWRALHPELLSEGTLIALGGSVTPDFTKVREVGFASLITSGTERIDDISVRGVHTPQTFSGPVPTLLAYEPWPRWSGSDPGRQHDEPLDGALHLTDSSLAVGLNETNGAAFVSASGYVFTGLQTDEQWAFTLRHAAPYMCTDFSIGSQDLQFDQGNSSGGQFRILLAQSAGGDYVISDEVFDYQRVGFEFNTETVDLDSLTWYDFDPGLMASGSLVAPDFSRIWEVGFASLHDTGTERIDNIMILGVAIVPEPTAFVLLAMGLAWLGLAVRRRRPRS